MIADVLCWAEGHTAIFNLVRRVSSAADRIFRLVTSIRSDSHTDRGSKRQPTHVHEGIDTTLTMLGRKLRKKNIQVERKFAENPPAISALPGELNQVWTNLIDKALDAMPAEGGVPWVETAPSRSALLVTITDKGSGIAPELQDRIFEPFFTAKPGGEGTGLGLDIVHRFVTRQQLGYFEVDSRPGCTRIMVMLPVGQPTAPAIA